MKRIRKLQILIFALILIFDCTLIGFAMTHNLYFNGEQQKLLYLNLKPQSSIYLNSEDSPSYVADGLYDMLYSDMNSILLNVHANWDAYSPQTSIEHLVSAHQIKNEYCGYDNKGNLKNGYLFPNILSTTISTSLRKLSSADQETEIKQKSVIFADTYVSGTFTIRAETPVAVSMSAYTANIPSSSKLPISITVPKSSFVFENIDNNIPREYLAESYTLTISQGPDRLYYESNSEPTSAQISNFVSNYTDKKEGIIVVITGTGSEYIWVDNRWSRDYSSSYVAETGNQLSFNLKANNLTGTSEFDVTYEINITAIKQKKVNTETLNYYKIRDIVNITNTSNSDTLTTGIIDSSKPYCIGVVHLDNSNNPDKLLDIVYSGTSSARYVTVQSDKIFEWSVTVSSMSMGGSEQSIITTSIKWSNTQDTSTAYPVRFFILYTP